MRKGCKMSHGQRRFQTPHNGTGVPYREVRPKKGERTNDPVGSMFDASDCHAPHGKDACRHRDVLHHRMCHIEELQSLAMKFDEPIAVSLTALALLFSAVQANASLDPKRIYFPEGRPRPAESFVELELFMSPEEKQTLENLRQALIADPMIGLVPERKKGDGGIIRLDPHPDVSAWPSPIDQFCDSNE